MVSFIHWAHWLVFSTAVRCILVGRLSVVGLKPWQWLMHILMHRYRQRSISTCILNGNIFHWPQFDIFDNNANLKSKLGCIPFLWSHFQSVHFQLLFSFCRKNIKCKTKVIGKRNFLSLLFQRNPKYRSQISETYKLQMKMSMKRKMRTCFSVAVWSVRIKHPWQSLP